MDTIEQKLFLKKEILLPQNLNIRSFSPRNLYSLYIENITDTISEKLIQNVNNTDIIQIDTIVLSDETLAELYLNFKIAKKKIANAEGTTINNFCMLNAAEICFSKISALLETGNYIFAALMTAIGFGFFNYKINYPGRFDVLTDECLAALFTEDNNECAFISSSPSGKMNIIPLINEEIQKISLLKQKLFNKPFVRIIIGKRTIILEKAKFSFFECYPIMVLPFLHCKKGHALISKILLIIITIDRIQHVYGILDNFASTY